MSAVAASGEADPHNVGRATESTAKGGGTGGPADKRVVVGYGFWIFLLSDIILFAALFAAFSVLRNATAGGPSGAELFDLTTVAIETGCLLASTYFCGLASVALQARNMVAFQAAMTVTFVFGAAFIGLEVNEFIGLVSEGAGPSRSAFLSAFFALVGCHGAHVAGGLLWLLTMMAQVFAKGITPTMERRNMCFALFWHALDIVWIAVFTIVYLFGAGL